MLCMLNLEKLAVNFEVLFTTGSIIHILLRWLSIFGQNQCIVYCMYTVVPVSFWHSTLLLKPYVLLGPGTSMPQMKRNKLGDFFHDNYKLFFASYFLVRLVQGVIKGNFLLLITASNLYHNPVKIS